ncbi:RNA polymerase sigma-70 factor (family 1) [Parabacteroides sp. PF5-5]|uniref:RNA polymerase sigma-70 factor n=1 Tax=unclassified Parabacteroides TaxID=2649774 RepID=UPI0024751A48|nr:MULTISPECIES: RNA polymerase sigma-70 factor [unclassified Parabacteroides]MDH6305644.1 RNA polymerase sigma-70 factor (family 1) [Parabacteroides sp. PH5-39]MDH6316318.1 RNA polymerase sigma-70 factor (family 1) [Parabacteroides sp. PF5-13]MDH6319801.1 RNA polymerase sigma-70 factor (family 1) [Parabacteroides sp. PH5-13]MDH6323608.1 RNA polymerase sigma-70 factor (family 1) [Parabacteroides sp. PH5-8]MDH6327505.1 RNA polymerase sigma-70 factor (family 1) [Parabacteroides sp. PH5-41]
MTLNEDTNKLMALESLFRSHYRPLRAYAFRFVNNREVAEDIVQDVFFELWSKRDTIYFDKPEVVKSYLFKSVYNRSLNALSHQTQKEQLRLENTNESLLLDDYLSIYMQNQEQSLLLKELKTEIGKFINTLPPQCKKVFILSRSYELKNKEIAEQLGISIKAVEKQITKALHELKNHLHKEGLLTLFLLYLQSSV